MNISSLSYPNSTHARCLHYAHLNISEFTHLHARRRQYRDKNWVQKLYREYDAIIYGGFLEDRSKLFDERHVTASTIHLGVDVWLPEGFIVFFPHLHESKLLYRSSDVGYVGGWGGRKDFLFDDEVWVFAHLDPYDELFLKDEWAVGKIGGKKVNGNWTPHLHIQRLSYDAYKELDPDDLDGYAAPDDPIISAHINPFDENNS
tara:strand:+ start:6065 stop:6673 length:609 start_codon:yes stop_codon:yes gene_type:complete